MNKKVSKKIPVDEIRKGVRLILRGHKCAECSYQTGSTCQHTMGSLALLEVLALVNKISRRQ